MTTLDSLLSAWASALRDILRPRTWREFVRSAASVDGLAVGGSMLLSSLILRAPAHSSRDAVGQFVLVLAFGLASMPSLARLASATGIRSAALSHPGLPERHWPALASVAGYVLLPLLLLLIASVLLFTLMLFLIPASLAAILFLLLAAVVFEQPLFRLMTHLHLNPREADALRVRGTWEGTAAPAHVRHLGVPTSLAFVVTWLAGNYATLKVMLLLAVPLSAPTVLPPTLSFLQPAQFGAAALLAGAALWVVQALFMSLFLGHLALPRVAALFKIAPPPEPEPDAALPAPPSIVGAAADHATVDFTAIQPETPRVAPAHPPYTPGTEATMPAPLRLPRWLAHSSQCPLSVWFVAILAVVWSWILVSRNYWVMGWSGQLYSPGWRELALLGWPMLYAAFGALLPFRVALARTLLLVLAAVHLTVLIAQGHRIPLAICAIYALAAIALLAPPARRFFRSQGPR